MSISASTDISDKAFDMDIHEVKEALSQIKSENPDNH